MPQMWSAGLTWPYCFQTGAVLEVSKMLVTWYSTSRNHTVQQYFLSLEAALFHDFDVLPHQKGGQRQANEMMSNLWYCRSWRLHDVKTQFVSLFVHRRTVFVSDSCDQLGVWKRLATVIGEVVLLQLQLPEMKSTALLCLLATVGHASRYPLRNRRFFVRFVQPMKWMGDISTQSGRWETLVIHRGCNNNKSLTSAKRVSATTNARFNNKKHHQTPCVDL